MSDGTGAKSAHVRREENGESKTKRARGPEGAEESSEAVGGKETRNWKELVFSAAMSETQSFSTTFQLLAGR